MQTYSHVVMTACLNRVVSRRALTKKRVPPLDNRAALIGSFAPDTPLILLALCFIIWDMAEGQLRQPSYQDSASSHTGQLFSDLFFNSPWVKTLHNLFHAPILATAYTLVGYWNWKKRGKAWGASLFWFGASCCLHTAIDIPLHHDDGPLLLFPFDLDLRFRSPVSYWDPKRFGREFGLFEHILLGFMLLFLVYLWITD